MEKPGTLIGRDREWQLLTRFAQSRRDDTLHLGVVSGRRRVGKTHLLNTICDKVGGLYHFCVQDEGDLAARTRFAARIARRSGVTTPADPGSWEQLLRTALTVTARTSPSGAAPFVVIDELPYAMAHAPELPGLIQLLYDESQRNEAPGGNLILCGSALSIMRELLSGGKALRGRALVDLRLPPLDYRLAATLWGITDPDTAFHVHACVGGYPGYRRLIEETPSRVEEFGDWVTSTLLTAGISVFTHNEVDYLLREDPRITDRAAYYDVFSAVARGATSLSKIGGATERSKDSARYLVDILRSTGYLNEEKDLLRKRSTITVTDPIIRFDRLITAPHFGQLDLGRSVQVWEAAAPTFRSQILGPHFEDLAREWLRRFAPDELGKPEGFGDVGFGTLHDHGGRAKHELDVLGVRGKSITFIGEAKATIHVRNTSDLERLEKIRDLLTELGHDTKSTTFGIFSRTGFSTDLVEAAHQREDVELVDLDRLYGTL